MIIATSHYTTIVNQFLAKKSIIVLYHPPYQIWHPQTKMKSKLKRCRFNTISDIQNNVMRNKRVFWQVSSVEAFRSLMTCHLCTELGGLYVDG